MTLLSYSLGDPYINEVTRAHGRGRFVLLYGVVFPIGLMVSNGVGAWLVPHYGWEMMYFIGGVPLVLFLSCAA